MPDIELTEQMIDAFNDAYDQGGRDQHAIQAGLKAVLRVASTDNRPTSFRDGDGDRWWLTSIGRYVEGPSLKYAEEDVADHLARNNCLGCASVNEIRAEYGEWKD